MLDALTDAFRSDAEYPIHIDEHPFVCETFHDDVWAVARDLEGGTVWPSSRRAPCVTGNGDRPTEVSKDDPFAVPGLMEEYGIVLLRGANSN